ncbi:hypothetical protein [Nocardia sp. AG03]|uniref:hypothetical protein n=1 Tax=Nocardia sp. AG03 TaxID=3025312 RepID=UPI0024187599|nr:hypothetical protein [Nocardia sp. AG03]
MTNEQLVRILHEQLVSVAPAEHLAPTDTDDEGCYCGCVTAEYSSTAPARESR